MRRSKESEGEMSTAEWRLVVMRRSACVYFAEVRVKGISTHDTIQIHLHSRIATL